MEVYQVRQTGNIVNCILNYEFVVNPRLFDGSCRAKMAQIDTDLKEGLNLIDRKQFEFYIQLHQIRHIGRL